jgi:hypothetical protein
VIWPFEVLNKIQEMTFLGRSPPLWAMGLSRALRAIAHRGGLLQRQKYPHGRHQHGPSNFIGPHQSYRAWVCFCLGVAKPSPVTNKSSPHPACPMANQRVCPACNSTPSCAAKFLGYPNGQRFAGNCKPRWRCVGLSMTVACTLALG